jgi:hypothetical protein
MFASIDFDSIINTATEGGGVWWEGWSGFE